MVISLYFSNIQKQLEETRTFSASNTWKNFRPTRLNCRFVARCWFPLHLDQQRTCQKHWRCKGNSWISNLDNCIGCWDANPFCQQKTKLPSRKSSINQHVRRVYKSEEVPFIQYNQPKTLGKLVNLSCYVSKQSFHNDLDMPFVKDEFRRLAMTYYKHFLRQGKEWKNSLQENQGTRPPDLLVNPSGK